MEQRRLRLGDILDDYCPRERRVTNHAVVAMIEEDVKQTRCTTCDAEHPYKGGKAPRKRKKETTGALYKEVLAGKDLHALNKETPAEPENDTAPDLADSPAPIEGHRTDSTSDDDFSQQDDAIAADSDAVADVDTESGEAPPPAEEGPVHRPLIRATLPRPEGQKDARPLPEFTVRHSGNRPGNGNYREHRMRQRGGGSGGNGPRTPGGQRFASPRGNGRGPGGRAAGGGFRAAHQPRHGGKKRSR